MDDDFDDDVDALIAYLDQDEPPQDESGPDYDFVEDFVSESVVLGPSSVVEDAEALAPSMEPSEAPLSAESHDFATQAFSLDLLSMERARKASASSSIDPLQMKMAPSSRLTASELIQNAILGQSTNRNIRNLPDWTPLPPGTSEPSLYLRSTRVGSKGLRIRYFSADEAHHRNVSLLEQLPEPLKPIPNLTPVRRVVRRSGGDMPSSPSKSRMLSEAFAPNRITDLISDPSTINKARWWAHSFDSRFFPERYQQRREAALTRNKLEPASEPRFPLLLLGGPAGSGKTTMARLLGSVLGYDVQIINASDERTAGSLESRLRTLSTTQSLSGNPVWLVLDEVDGLDPKAFQMIMRLAPSFRIPIVCTANNLFAKGMWQLRQVSRVLNVETGTQLVSRLEHIAHEADLAVSSDVLDWLVKRTDGDIRASLNALHFASRFGRKIKKRGLKSGLMLAAASSDVDVLLEELFKRRDIAYDTELYRAFLKPQKRLKGSKRSVKTPLLHRLFDCDLDSLCDRFFFNSLKLRPMDPMLTSMCSALEGFSTLDTAPMSAKAAHLAHIRNHLVSVLPEDFPLTLRPAEDHSTMFEQIERVKSAIALQRSRVSLFHFSDPLRLQCFSMDYLTSTYAILRHFFAHTITPSSKAQLMAIVPSLLRGVEPVGVLANIVSIVILHFRMSGLVPLLPDPETDNPVSSLLLDTGIESLLGLMNRFIRFPFFDRTISVLELFVKALTPKDQTKRVTGRDGQSVQEIAKPMESAVEPIVLEKDAFGIVRGAVGDSITDRQLELWPIVFSHHQGVTNTVRRTVFLSELLA